jgi:3' terminal RNA ribose 2'-O-methyltransferase Hen1
VLLTIATTHEPATDLGYLLHKHPDRAHQADLSFGRATVVFPEATALRCTAALVVEVDPVGLARDRRTPSGFSLAPYVNDRPYAASSFLSSAIGRMYGTALGGRSRERPELATTPIPLEAHLPVVPVRGGEPLLRRLFEPLGYEVAATSLVLDDAHPGWGDSRYVDVTLRTSGLVRHLLEHLYVLLPVLDDHKHHWVGPEEVDKLLRRGGDWLATHPDRELVTRRYLRHSRRLTSEALSRLLEHDGTLADVDRESVDGDRAEAAVEDRVSLAEQRSRAVVATLREVGARTVVDLGCGEGRLVRALLRESTFTRVVGLDVSPRALTTAARRLRLDDMTPRQRARVDLWQGALTYRDARLAAFDAACVSEVIEHLDPPRLGAFERVLFAEARPATVVVTTPNIEHNVRFDALPAGRLRHRDHRFEWTRAQFAEWAGGVAARHGYRVTFEGVGTDDPEVGSPTQMAVFEKGRVAR